MPSPLPDRCRRLAPLVLRLLPFAAAAVTLMLVMGRHERVAGRQADLLGLLDEGGLVVVQAGTCQVGSRIPVARTVASDHCLGAGEHLPFLADIARDRSQAAARTRALRALVASWRGPGNLLVLTHPANIAALAELVVPGGDAVVMRPQPSGGEVLGQLKAASSSRSPGTTCRHDDRAPSSPASEGEAS